MKACRCKLVDDDELATRIKIPNISIYKQTKSK